LAACTVLASVQYAHLPPTHSVIYAYLWSLVAFSYPLGLTLSGSGLRFWSGILTLLLILTIAHLFELGVILGHESGGLLHPDLETVVLFGFYCIGPGASAIIWFPLGYLATRFLIRRKVD
jgi:hypothetical protein